MPPSAPRPGIPRHWDVELGGIRWLPRLIDKARMRERGELGAYLCGHSPVDQALLKRTTLTTDQFVALVAEHPTDEGVLEALRVAGFDSVSARRWSERFHQHYRMWIPLWELDEGYVTPKPWQRLLMSGFKRMERPIMDAVRKIFRAP